VIDEVGLDGGAKFVAIDRKLLESKRDVSFLAVKLKSSITVLV